jgi:protein gp37
VGFLTGIPWCHHTFNQPWGCSKVSPLCDNCYAEVDDRRYNLDGGRRHWGPGAPRLQLSDEYWRQPPQWDRLAAGAGERRRVFCSAHGDVFDNEWDAVQRQRLFRLIRATPNLDWLLLTKRIQNAPEMLPDDWGSTGYPNVWLIISVGQRELDRGGAKLMRIPALVHGLSVEPMLAPVTLRGLAVDWVIIGGEGIGKRPFDINWARALMAECKAARIPVFVKQMGFRPVEGGRPLKFKAMKGANPDEWPVDLRMRQFPR